MVERKLVELTSKQAMGLVMKHHYSRRKVGCKFAFGLLEGGELVGCVCYSVPASYTLCEGVCGKAYSKQVLELSRLVVTTQSKNSASYMIGQSLRLLGNWIVVSYADCNKHVGHVGYVYQATNWLFTGNGNAEPKWLHPETGEVISYTRRHIDKKAEALGMNWKQLRKEKQLGKLRYVTFAGDRRFKRDARRALKYPVLGYPKGDTKRHEPEPEQSLFLI